jgi:hypothetical protein
MATNVLPNGATSQIRQRSDEIMATFDALDPFSDGTPFWQVEAEGTVTLFGSKKYVILGEDGSVLAHTDAVLGAFVPPPGFGQRDASGRYVWTGNVARLRALRQQFPSGLFPEFEWEATSPGWPALERHSVSTPDASLELPEAFGRRPFCRIVEAIATYHDAHPVAIDPGGDLRAWRSLAWYDARRAAPIRITTDPEDIGTVVVDSLRARAIAWGRQPEWTPPSFVAVDQLLVRLVGRSGGVFVDASPQQVFREVDAAEVLVKAAGQLQSARFRELTRLPERTSDAIAAGRVPKPMTVDRAFARLQDRLGADPLPQLLDLAEKVASEFCRWPGCEGVPARAGASWCALHRRRSGVDRRRVLSEVKR